ncbi:MAG: ferritin family protein [Thermodesulfobacteriota bacterium]|nr:ferritin family protein [Thermodesulfobacteriota bacterium]
MSYDMNADEIFEMAEQIEKNGAEFYRQAAGSISDAPVRQLLLDFASMEDEHLEVFASMRAELSDQERRSTVFDPEGEAAQYLRALADLRVFDKAAKEDFILLEDLSEQEKAKQVFRGAIAREKESIVFYLGMKELVPEKLGKNRIDNIIREEMKHVRMLSNRYASL